MPNQKIIIISLGGSIVSPKAGEINILFLKKFKRLILKFLGKGFKFVVIAGGGKTARLYQNSALKIARLPNKDRDWLGIEATRLNAHLLKTIFKQAAYPEILDQPQKKAPGNWKLLIAAGWRPGCSTDYIAVLLAKRFKIKKIVNAGDVSFVYDKDPNKYKKAKSFKKISWKAFRKIVGWRWSPGLSAPFDPVAAKLAEKLKIRVLIVKGTELKNLEKAIAGKNFQGTIIE